MNFRPLTFLAAALVTLTPASAAIVGFTFSGVTTTNFVEDGALTSEYPVGTPWTARIQWDTAAESLFLSDSQGQFPATELTLTFTGQTGTWTTSALAGKSTYTLNSQPGSNRDELQFTTSWGPTNQTNGDLEEWQIYSINVILTDPTGTAIPTLASAPKTLNLADWSPLVADSQLKIYLNNDGNRSILGNIQSIRSMFGPEIAIKLPNGKNAIDGLTVQNFGNVTVGKTSKPKTYVIRNTGSTPISELKASKAGAHKGDFILGPISKTSLAPGASAKVTVAFKPKIKGKRKAVLKISSKQGGTDSFEINLVGTGVQP